LNSNIESCPDGWIVEVQPVEAAGGGLRSNGRYYVIAMLLRGRTGATAELEAILWADYITGGNTASFPNIEVTKEQSIFTLVFCGSNGAPAEGPIQVKFTFTKVRPVGKGSIHFSKPFEGRGDSRTISLGDPAAGAQYATITVPAFVKWKLRAGHGQLVTSAVVNTRQPAQSHDDGVNVYGGGAISAGSGQSASETTDWFWGPNLPGGGPGATTPGRGTYPVTDSDLRTVHRISFQTSLFDAGDNWGPGFLQVEEWAGPSA